MNNHCLAIIAILLCVCKSHDTVTGCHGSFKETYSTFDGLLPRPATHENSSSLYAQNSCFTVKQLSTPSSSALSDFCFPSVLVAGFPKCATSFLYHALSKHPNILPTRRKELCLGGPLSETWPKFTSFLPSILETTLSSASSLEGKLVMTGCLHLGANIRAVKQLCIPPTKTRVIFLVRDAADMLWAAYNYWCNVDTDDSCIPGELSADRNTFQMFFILLYFICRKAHSARQRHSDPSSLPLSHTTWTPDGRGISSKALWRVF